MAIEKIIDITVNAEPAVEATKSLKAQLREAQQEVAALSDKFGATSKEAVEAAKRAAELKDRIGDAKALTDAFNPDAKFKALTSSLAGVAGGFAAVQGAMNLFGAESSEVEKTLLKVQSAMALAQGLQQVGESVDAFKQLGAVVQSLTVVQKISTAAQWLWNAAMAANPIGAIVAAIAALLVAGYKLVSYFIESSEANEQAMEATKKNTQALKEQAAQYEKSTKALENYNKYQYDLAKANGASAESLRKLAIENAREEEALAKKNAMLAQATFLRERDTLANLKANDASDEVIEAQQKLTEETYKEFTKQRDNYYKQKDNVVAVIRQQNVEIAQANTDARDKEEEKRKQAREKEKEDAKKRAKEIKEQREKDLKDLLEAEERYRDSQRSLYDEVTQAIGDAYDRQAEFGMTAGEAEERNIQDKYFRLIELAKQQGRSKEEIDALEIDRENALNDVRLKNQFNTTEQIIQNEKYKAQAKQEIEQATLDVVSNGISMLKGMFEKNKAIQKGLLIAESAVGIAKIIVNTQTANAVAKASPINLADPTYGTRMSVINTIAAGIGIAANVAATAKALSQLGGGGGAGAGASAGSASGGGASAPSFNIVGDAGVNSLTGAVQQNKQAPIQTYVVAQNVTTAQSLNRNIVENATLG
jgi:hypothetical protein